MTEPVPCPNCQALLRLPVGATTVRCPGCRAILELDLDEPLPPPPPVARAIPLPFGRPAKPVATTPLPVASAAKSKATPKRARLVVEDPYAQSAPSAEMLVEDEKLRLVKRELADIEDEEDRKEDRFQVLAGECRQAQLGLRLFAFGSLASSLAVILATFFIVTALTAVPFLPLMMLAGAVQFVHWCLLIAGFGICMTGPKPMRGTSLVGLVFTIGHMLLNGVGTLLVLPVIGIDMLGNRDGNEVYVFSNLLVSNSICNLTTVADLPFYVMYPTSARSTLFVVLLLAACLEFAKVCTLGILTNQYATAGKDPDLAYSGMRFVYRIFAVVFVGPMLKGGVAALFAVGIIWMPMLFITVGYYLWWAFAWFAQFQVLNDTREIVTAVRFTDRRERLDYV